MAIRCVIGLGNPGLRYEWTRHNVGFWVVDLVARDGRLDWRRLDDAFEAIGEVCGRRMIFLKPQTYMNRSGSAVLDCLERHDLIADELLVVVDDAALPVSRLRLRRSGGPGGHRGLESIEESIGSRNYPRLRLGVGGAEEGEDLADFLLRPLDTEERSRFAGIAERGAEAVREAVTEGIDAAMNRFNTPPDTDVDAGTGEAEDGEGN